MTLPRTMDLQWQQEVLERWLSASDTPTDARPELLNMLQSVKKEMEELEASRNLLASLQTRQAS